MKILICLVLVVTVAAGPEVTSNFEESIVNHHDHADHDSSLMKSDVDNEEDHFERGFRRYGDVEHSDHHHSDNSEENAKLDWLAIIESKETKSDENSESRSSESEEGHHSHEDHYSNENNSDDEGKSGINIDIPKHRSTLHMMHHHDHHLHNYEDQDISRTVHQHFHLRIPEDQFHEILEFARLYSDHETDDEDSSSHDSEHSDFHHGHSDHHDISEETEYPQHVFYSNVPHHQQHFFEHFNKQRHGNHDEHWKGMINRDHASSNTNHGNSWESSEEHDYRADSSSEESPSFEATDKWSHRRTGPTRPSHHHSGTRHHRHQFDNEQRSRKYFHGRHRHHNSPHHDEDHWFHKDRKPRFHGDDSSEEHRSHGKYGHGDQRSVHHYERAYHDVE